MTGSLSQTRGRPEPGRELDALIAEKVMGAVRLHVGTDGELYGAPAHLIADGTLAADHGRIRLPRYSTDIAAVFAVVERVQALHRGWRFSLLGGDRSFGYTRLGDEDAAVDKTRVELFGWRASFFGDEDPTQNYGQRHADEWAATPAHAICLAALAALSPADDGGAR